MAISIALPGLWTPTFLQKQIVHTIIISALSKNEQKVNVKVKKNF